VLRLYTTKLQLLILNCTTVIQRCSWKVNPHSSFNWACFWRIYAKMPIYRITMKLNILAYNFWILQAWLVTLKCSSGEVHTGTPLVSIGSYRWSAQYMLLLFNWQTTQLRCSAWGMPVCFSWQKPKFLTELAIYTQLRCRAWSMPVSFSLSNWCVIPLVRASVRVWCLNPKSMHNIYVRVLQSVVIMVNYFP